MKREEEYFDGRELVLVYIARKLREALAVEGLMTEAGIDYLVEVDTYIGGIIFRGERAGAFFYVEEAGRDGAAALLREKGYRPQADQA